MEHKYKDKDNYKYKDKDGDAKTITGILTVCYIFGILMTRQVQPSTAQYSLEPLMVLHCMAQYCTVRQCIARCCMVLQGLAWCNKV